MHAHFCCYIKVLLSLLLQLLSFVFFLSFFAFLQSGLRKLAGVSHPRFAPKLFTDPAEVKTTLVHLVHF